MPYSHSPSNFSLDTKVTRYVVIQNNACAQVRIGNGGCHCGLAHRWLWIRGNLCKLVHGARFSTYVRRCGATTCSPHLLSSHKACVMCGNSVKRIYITCGNENCLSVEKRIPSILVRRMDIIFHGDWERYSFLVLWFDVHQTFVSTSDRSGDIDFNKKSAAARYTNKTRIRRLNDTQFEYPPTFAWARLKCPTL